MAGAQQGQRAQSALLGLAGMTLISPDGLIVNAVGGGLGPLLFVRGLFMAAGYLLIVRVRTGSFFKNSGWKLRSNTLAFGVLGCLGNVAFVTSLRETTVADALLINASMPAMAGAIGWLSGSERPTRRGWASAVGVLVGMALLIAAHPGRSSILGDAAAAGSAITFACALLVVPRDDDSALPVAQTLEGALTMVVSCPFAGRLRSARSLSLAALGFGCTLPIGSTLLMTGRRHLSAVEVGLLTLLETVLGPLWAWVGLGQRPNLQTVGAGAVIVVSLAVYLLAGSARFGDTGELGS